jgi:outer membrane protein TolC
MRHFPVLAWGLLVLAVTATGAAAGGNKDDKTEEINRLLVERHKKLGEVAKVLMAQYKDGRVGFERVTQAQRAVLKAALDLPQSPEKRLATLREFRDLADSIFKFTEQRFKAGFGSQTEVLEAEAALLEARIQLLREEAKAKPRK